jgi:uncharacterized protein YbgA (DUF1722 family)
MKVPQTFTITIEQAGFLAQMKSGQRSSWVRAAIDTYRKGPVGVQRELELYEGIVEKMSQYLEQQGTYTDYLKWVAVTAREEAKAKREQSDSEE